MAQFGAVRLPKILVVTVVWIGRADVAGKPHGQGELVRVQQREVAAGPRLVALLPPAGVQVVLAFARVPTAEESSQY